MSLQNLPAGSNFRLNSGAGSFAKKLSQATQAASLHHLRDHRESIIKALSPMEKLIRQGKFSRFQRSSALSKIKSLEKGNLSSVEKRDIKKILAHISQAAASPEKNNHSTVAKTTTTNNAQNSLSEPKREKTLAEKRSILKRNLASRAAAERAALSGHGPNSQESTGLRSSAQINKPPGPPTASGFRATSSRQFPL